MKKIKATQIQEWARGNGIPCHGDMIETVIDGTVYRAEFYAIAEFGNPPELCLAADSYIEKKVNGVWERLEFPNTEQGDEEFSELLAKITPELEDDRYD